ncbi:MAG: hypothetical protein KKH98_01280 [Spirochaetes bacterium]|nr:hypothetical protein [Spirochaetota bacterium]
MKKIIFLLILSVLLSCSNKSISSSNNQGYEGRWIWEKNNNNQDFSLTIKKENNIYYGSHCGIFLKGNRIDCSENNETSFKFIDTKGNEIITDFISFYSRAKGKIKLKLKKDKLIWEIIQPPKDNYYCPLKATLIKKYK